MKKMTATAFKANCLKIMDEVQASREPVVITKRGKPVVKIVPRSLTRMTYLGSCPEKSRSSATSNPRLKIGIPRSDIGVVPEFQNPNPPEAATFPQ